jgi:hypothetical protein
MGKTKGYSEVVNQRSDKTMGKTKGYSEFVNHRTDNAVVKRNRTKGHN